MVHKIIFCSVTCIAAISCNAQSRDSLNRNNKKTLLDLDDSLSVFELIDSLVQFPDLLDGGSCLVARMGYNSNITSANQSIGLNQFGLSPGVTYYHKSGFYLDVTGYWSHEYAPGWYLTVASAGYLRTVKKWTVNIEYSRYIYSFSDSTYNSPYTNTATLSNFFDVKPFLFRLDYSFYFGQKNAHRVMPSVMFNLEKKNWLGMKRVLLYPTFSILYGNDSWQDSQYIPYSTILADVLARIHNNQPLYYLTKTNKNEFGVLNYSVSLPLSISLQKWTFQLSYTYNFPQPLPGEPLGLTNSGYVSFSVIRYITSKSNSTLIDFYKLPK